MRWFSVSMATLLILCLFCGTITQNDPAMQRKQNSPFCDNTWLYAWDTVSYQKRDSTWYMGITKRQSFHFGVSYVTKIDLSVFGEHCPVPNPFCDTIGMVNDTPFVVCNQCYGIWGGNNDTLVGTWGFDDSTLIMTFNDTTVETYNYAFSSDEDTLYMRQFTEAIRAYLRMP